MARRSKGGTRLWFSPRDGPARGGKVKVGLAESADTGNFYNCAIGSMPAILAPADSPSEEQFTLGNVAAELELEPRRANLLGAFDDAADGQDEPADAADGAAA